MLDGANDGERGRDSPAEKFSDARLHGAGPFADDDALTYDAVVAFYRHLDSRIPDRFRPAVFGGPGVVGAGTFFLQLRTFVAEPSGVGASLNAAVVGLAAFLFAVGYYAVRVHSSCSECGTPFSRRRTGVRQVRRGGRDAADRVYLESTFECRACNCRTVEPNSSVRDAYHQF
ncbi:hypothetical protein [Halorussus amylolyticus]|uniref:hypothetical protein n=1 Tax=Halorussus amylolyticus TaxID=1126242 RepID=UPI001048DA80|nr:hypothetical protein [Halorussus amylolyticus]